MQQTHIDNMPYSNHRYCMLHVFSSHTCNLYRIVISEAPQRCEGKGNILPCRKNQRIRRAESDKTRWEESDVELDPSIHLEHRVRLLQDSKRDSAAAYVAIDVLVLRCKVPKVIDRNPQQVHGANNIPKNVYYWTVTCNKSGAIRCKRSS
jgi:hypothetical protein